MNSGIRPVTCSRARAVLRAYLLLCLSFGTLLAQDRLLGPLNLGPMVALKGQNRPPELARYDQGPAEPSFQIRYATLLLKPDSAQRAELDRLLADQQDFSSQNFHRWLTPEQFGDRFGLSPGDISKISGWLSSQGLQVHDVARGRHWVTFSGAASDVNRTFHTEMHRYQINGKDYFANATELSIPAAFENVVAGVAGLNDLHKARRSSRLDAQPAQPAYTDSNEGHELTPGDLATIYNVNPLYTAGIDGTGQKVAIAGGTDIFVEDIEAFRTKYHLPANDPQIITFGPDPGYDFDGLFEADLDLEWSGGMAPKATIIYVEAFDIFVAAEYAVDANVAPILSISAGFCEPAGPAAFQLVGQQANAQGITWVASSGDSGAAGCEIQDAYSLAGKGLAVTIPASLPEVTAVGGTEFNEGTGNYWAPLNNPNGSSALSYIPERAWNDTSKGSPLGATGGGASIFYSKPLWQTGSGVPADKARDVPDVSLSASAAHDPYLVAFLGSFYGIGGTSASAPSFAGMLALLSHYLESKKLSAKGGLGNINPMLYRLAQTEPAAFHDVKTGSNIVPCVEASPNCVNGALGYLAGPGYDQATGLGSVDLNDLVTHWTVGPASTTKLTASPSAITAGEGSVQLTATVTGAGGTPTGTVSFTTPDNTFGSAPLVSSGDKAVATLAVDATQFVLGTHSVTAVYSGDNTWNGSAATTNVTVKVPASGTAVSPSVSPDLVLRGVPDAKGLSWHVTLDLSEEAGVGATVTNLSINGVSYDDQLSTIFKTTTIPPHATISGPLGFASLAVPLTQVFVFSGKDVAGNSWTAQTSAQFVSAMEVAASLTLSSTPSTIVQKKSNTACPWQQQLTVQNQSGYYVGLLNFAMDSTDLTGMLQQIFGTTQIGPFGSLQGTYCRTKVSPPETRNFVLTGYTEFGQLLESKLTATFQAAVTSPATMSVSPASVTIPVANSSAAGNSLLALKFSAGMPDWTISILPSNPTTSWLTVSPLAGSGPAQVTIKTAPGTHGKGVYSAMLVIQAVNSTPQFLNVPVTLLVGDTTSIKIGGVSNAGSSLLAFAPGMSMSVYGSHLAPDGTSQKAGTLPLPLTLAGVSATVNGQTAPLFFVSPGQLNIQVPFETPIGAAVLGVNNNGQVASFQFPVAFAAPGIFTGSGGALVPNATGKAGDTLLAFITGAGVLTPTVPTGVSPSADTPVSDLPLPLAPVTVTVGGLAAKVNFAGVPAGLVGIVQINFVVPGNVAAGPQPVVVKVGGIASPPATLTITQ